MTAMADNAPFQVFAPAGVYFRVMVAGLGQVPESTRLVLQRDVDGSPLAWPLALVLAGWRLVERGGSLPSEFATSGADKLVAQIKQFKSAFPKSFVSFLEAAERSEEAAATSYFKSALTDLADYARPVLNGWLASQPFLQAAQRLVAGIGGAPKPARQGPKEARPRFEAPIGNPGPADRAALLTGKLASLGWSKLDIDRILVGPGKAPLTADRLYRQIAANKPEVQAAVTSKLKASSQRPAADNEPADTSLLAGSTLRTTGVEQLLAEFGALPALQQQRLLTLLQQNPLTNPDVGQIGKPKAGATGKNGKTAPVSETDTGKIADAVKSGIGLATETIKRLLGQGGSTTGKTRDGAGKASPDRDADNGDGDTPGKSQPDKSGTDKDKGGSSEKSMEDDQTDDSEKSGNGEMTVEEKQSGEESLPDDAGGDGGDADSLPDDSGGGRGEADSLPDDAGGSSTPDSGDYEVPNINDSADVID